MNTSEHGNRAQALTAAAARAVPVVRMNPDARRRCRACPIDRPGPSGRLGRRTGDARARANANPGVPAIPIHAPFATRSRRPGPCPGLPRLPALSWRIPPLACLFDRTRTANYEIVRRSHRARGRASIRAASAGCQRDFVAKISHDNLLSPRRSGAVLRAPGGPPDAAPPAWRGAGRPPLAALALPGQAQRGQPAELETRLRVQHVHDLDDAAVQRARRHAQLVRDHLVRQARRHQRD